MRLFIAIQLNNEMLDALAEVQGSLRFAGARGSFTKAENLHLTLAFIGEMPCPDEALEALETVSFRPFDLRMDGCGCFGDLWWVGVSDTAALEAVARRVRRALVEAGVPFDRKRFVPHITVLRRADFGRNGLAGNDPDDSDAGRANLPALQIPDARMTVRRISLMRSDRGKNGMIYTEIGAIEAD